MKSLQSNRWKSNRVFQMPKMTKFWDRLYPNFGSAKIKPILTIPQYSNLKLKVAKRLFGSKKTFRAKIELKITQEKLRCKLSDFLNPLEHKFQHLLSPRSDLEILNSKKLQIDVTMMAPNLNHAHQPIRTDYERNYKLNCTESFTVRN